MSSLSKKLISIHNRTPAQKMVVLEHNIHIKLLFPIFVWVLTLPFLTPSISSIIMAALSGLFMALFFMPAPYWSENKITTPRTQIAIKIVALIGFLIVMIMASLGAIINKVNTSWFLVQYISVYMTMFLAIAMVLKATKTYRATQKHSAAL